MGIMSKDYHASNRAMWEIGGIWASTFQGLPMRKKGPSLLKPVAPEPLKQVEIRDEITPETPAARISRQRLMTWDNFVLYLAPLRKERYGMGTAPTVMSHWLSVTPERVVKWILAVPGATDHAVPYGSIEMTSGFELVQVPYS